MPVDAAPFNHAVPWVVALCAFAGYPLLLWVLGAKTRGADGTEPPERSRP